jgi:hypothetical protein
MFRLVRILMALPIPDRVKARVLDWYDGRGRD